MPFETIQESINLDNVGVKDGKIIVDSVLSYCQITVPESIPYPQTPKLRPLEERLHRILVFKLKLKIYSTFVT